jgi:hypothetical protein
MPVRLMGESASGLRISADGALPSRIDVVRGGDIVVPFLPVSDLPSELTIDGKTVAKLQALGERQRLVAVAEGDADAATVIFPTEEIVPVALDLNHPLLEPPLAWCGLDAVVLSAATRARVSDAQLSTLLAAGVAFVVSDDRLPDDHWPWQRIGNVWVLRHKVAGPRDPIRAEAYTPTYAWDRGLPAPLRRQVVLSAAVFGIMVVALSLWRSRRATIGFLAIVLGSTGLVFLIYLQRPPELMMRKLIAVSGPRFTQTDAWVWRACVRECEMSEPVVGMTSPVFASGRQVGRSQIELKCDSRGSPIAYTFRLGTGQSLAFLNRDLVMPVTPKLFTGTTAMWKDFALDLYVRPGERVEGEARVDDQRIGTFITTEATR